MWVCPSCLMENDDSDLNCYMCGEKRPHIAPLRKPKEPQPGSEPALQQEPRPAPACEPNPAFIPEPVPAVQESAPVVRASSKPAAEQKDKNAQTDATIKKELISEFVEAIKPSESVLAENEPVREKNTQEENPFAGIFNVQTPPAPTETPLSQAEVPYSQPQTASTQEKKTDDFHTVFNDFLNALQQQEAQTARPFVQTDVNGNIPHSQPQTPPTEETKPKKRREKKKRESQTVGDGAFSFMRSLFAVVMFVWGISFVLFMLARFTDGDPEYIRYMADELAYLFERGISELKLSDFAEYFMSLLGSL